MESIINPDYYLLGVFVALAVALVATIVRGERTMKSAREQEKKAKDAEISYQNALADLKCSTKHIWATYKFSESDFNKFGPDHRAMEREARQRMACALGRRIVKELGATELIEKGVLIGYKIEVDVRKCIPPIEELTLAAIRLGTTAHDAAGKVVELKNAIGNGNR